MPHSDAKKYLNSWKKCFLVWQFIENQVFITSVLFPIFSVFSLSKFIQFVCLVMEWYKTYIDRKSIYSLQVVLYVYQKSLEEVLRRLKDVLRTSFGRHLEDVSWKTSCGRLKKRSSRLPFQTNLRRLWDQN